MTDAEIIKALEVCCGNIKREEECDETVCYQSVLPESRDGDTRWCRQWLIKDALDLINRQKAEIEMLNKEVDRLSQVVMYHDGQVADTIKDFAERVKQEINFPLAVWKVFDNLVKEMVGDA